MEAVTRDLTRDPDPEPMRVIVTAIPFVDVDTASFHAGELLDVGDHGTERVPIEGIAMQCLGVRAGFTLADALDLRGM